MDERDKQVIRRCYVRLEKNLEASTHLSYLYQDNVLSNEDMDKINAKPTTKKQAAKLLKILQKRKHGLRMLIKALLLAKVQDFLAYELLEIVKWTDEEIESFHTEVEEKFDRYQLLEIEMATLQNKYNELECKHEHLKADYQQTVKDLNRKVINLQQQLDDALSASQTGSLPSPTVKREEKRSGWITWVFPNRSQRKERRHRKDERNHEDGSGGVSEL